MASPHGRGGPDLEPLLPRGGDVGRQPQRADARVMSLQVFPEPQRQHGRQAIQREVVDAGLPFAQVIR